MHILVALQAKSTSSSPAETGCATPHSTSRRRCRLVCSFSCPFSNRLSTTSGSNFVQGSLNWGPAPNLNGVSHSYSWWTDKRRSFASDFHTYALEWTEDFMYVRPASLLRLHTGTAVQLKLICTLWARRRIYVDTRLHTLLDLRFDQPFFRRGAFPDVVFNGSSLVALQDPWINGTNATPFDQGVCLVRCFSFFFPSE
jgi:hypothetical protein